MIRRTRKGGKQEIESRKEDEEEEANEKGESRVSIYFPHFPRVLMCVCVCSRVGRFEGVCIEGQGCMYSQESGFPRAMKSTLEPMVVIVCVR